MTAIQSVLHSASLAVHGQEISRRQAPRLVCETAVAVVAAVGDS